MKQFSRTPALFLAASLVALQGQLPKIFGTAGDDIIDGSYSPPTTDSAEEINGLAGNDTIDAQGGDDVVSGGAGNDTIRGGGGADEIDGGGEDDTIRGDGGDDILEGGQGNDEIYGGPGNDQLEGDPHDDYLDGNDGVDTVDGGTNDDLVIGRGGDDTLIGGTGHDFLVIIGNSVANYTIHGDSADPGTGNTGDDILYFAADVNPKDFKVLTVTSAVNGQTFEFRELEFSYRTKQPVTLDVQKATNMRHVEGFATGTGNDVLLGTDLSGKSTYWARFLHSGTPMQVDELFFTDAGDDTITTRGGSDFVDAGPGNDTIHLGSGAHIVWTGPGDDAVRLKAAELDGPEGGRHTRILDLQPSDAVYIDGSVAPADITLSQAADSAGVGTTTVSVNGTSELELVGVPQADVQVAATKGGVRITASQVAAPPSK